MSNHPQFAYTGPTPATGYVGYANIQETEGGVRFTVRSEGENPVTASYELPKAEAIALLGKALVGLGGPLKHDYWMAGQADCPREIKAGNGELHTLRCKRCGEDNPRGQICLPA
jgi:hypothetical protein